MGTPKLAVFTITSCTADATTTAHNRWGMGATDGTNEACITYHDEDAGGSAVANRWGTTTKCIAISNTGSVGPDGEAEFVSFSNNSVTINWTNAPSSAFLMTVELYEVQILRLV